MQFGAKMWLVSSVTAPVCASDRPSRLAPVPRLMLVSARMFPRKLVPDPIVAELPTCHHTLHAEPPLVTTTDAPTPGVVLSPLARRKIQTAAGSPPPSRVRGTPVVN